MLSSRKKILGLFLVAGLLITTMGMAHAQSGIASYYISHYKHATQVLQQEYPAFLTAFQSFQDEIKTIDSSNKQAQHDALMRFFPSLKEMAFMDSYKATQPDNAGIRWNLQMEVVVSYFVIDLPTSDNQTIKLFDVIFNSFNVSLAGGDAVGIASEQDIMKKHNMTREEAQEVRAVLKQLFPSSTLM